MNCFGDWFAAKFPHLVPPRRAATPRPDVQPTAYTWSVLPEGLYETAGGRLMATCRACERDYEWEGDEADGFDPDYSYCGGSPRCLP